MRRARSPAPISRSTAAGRPHSEGAAAHDGAKEHQSRAARRRLARRLHLGRARLSARGRAARHCGGQRHQRGGDERRRPRPKAGCENGRDGAREKLARFLALDLDGECAVAGAEPVLRSLLRPADARRPILAFWGPTVCTHLTSPYQFNPLRSQSVAATISKMPIDFEKVRAFDGFKLFVAATNVRTRQDQGLQAARS